ncbi:restriction endonuclease subunit S [Flavobacterium petrolei]|uniref:restriction endonuclease subunit S n=1 Tax=Flavobacterium petrolei TaxID=2259594 RepID=UPI0037582A64
MNKNKLPKDWKWVKLKEICKVVTGTTPPKSDMSNYGNDIPFFKPPHLWDGLVSSTNEMLSTVGGTKARIVPPNTVLVTCIGNLGRTGFVKKEAAFNQQINAILANEKIDGKYIFYQAQSPNFRNQLEKLATGTTVSIVNKGNFETISIPLAPHATQTLIVSKIEELFSELDKGIEDLKTSQQQLKTYRQSVLKYAFEGKLTNKKVKEGELPKGWKKVTIGDVCHNVEYGSGTKSKKEGKIPVLRMGNIQNGIFDWNDLVYSDDDIEIKKYLLKKNDVLFNRTNSAELVGKTAIYKGERPAIFAGYLIRINRIEELIDSAFITYYLNSKEAKKYGNSVRSFGVNQSNINGTKLKTYPLLLPLLEEQHLIVLEIESRLSVADKMEESIAQSLLQAEALRQSILKKAFSGELV